MKLIKKSNQNKGTVVIKELNEIVIYLEQNLLAELIQRL